MRFAIRLSPDITIKSTSTRRRFLRRLSANLQDSFKSHGVRASVENQWARLYLTSEDALTEMAASKVFGVLSVARIHERHDPTLSQLVEEAAGYFLPRIEGKSFAVRARCTGSTTFRGGEVEIELGAALAEHGRVQLVQPEVTCFVEVRDGLAHYYCDRMPGPSGLPLGTEGRAVALISGGFDSAVAAWMMMRRGVDLSYVFCRLGGAVHTQATLRVIDILAKQWSFGSQPRVYIVPFEQVVEEIREKCRPAYWQLVLKRKMYRVAQEIAYRARAHAIVTGESLGQVSSQTFRNLTALDQPLEVPVLRPLLALDKEAIIDRARRIGTFEISATVQEYCAINAKKPVVATKKKELDEEENAVPLNLEGLGKKVRALRARNMSARHFQIDGLEIDEIPDKAVVLDLRGKLAFEAWHYPGSLRMDLSQALKAIDAFDRDKTYVVLCEIGLKSAHLAEEMQKRNLIAYNFRGGMRPLIRYAIQRQVVPAEVADDPAMLWM